MLSYNGVNTKFKVYSLLSFALLAAFICSLLFGTVSVTLSELASVALNGGDSSLNLIIKEIRLPRALLAMSIGVLLAVSGVIMQGLFRNPLADPSLIGITAGASVGASLAIFFSSSLMTSVSLASSTGLPIISLGAFVGGLMTVLLVYRLSRHGLETSVSTMLLAGIAITALCASVSSFLDYVSSNEMLRRLSLWRMGGIDGATYSHVVLASIMSVLLLMIIPRISITLNAMLLGESEARYLGINVSRLKVLLITLVAMSVGLSVALAGTIAFVGLVVPHIMRIIVGPDHRILLPMTALAGALLMLIADTLARTIIAPTELPVGLLTSILGAPFFIILLRRRHRGGF